MPKRNTTTIVEMAKEKTSTKAEMVLREIDKMRRKGEKITIYSVSKTTKVSRSFLYNSKLLFDKINSYRNGAPKSHDTVQTIIKAQQLKIAKLEREIDELKKAENYKKKYEELLSQNKELKKQLEASYSY